MITKVSELLKGFLDEELKKLDKFKIDHKPTIGSMYEGLTMEILDRAIPRSLNLGIRSGFIYDDTGSISGQIDCMLVKGNGIQIPYTTDFKWNIRDVIAVFEVKKTLYSSDLEDSYKHLRSVYTSYSNYIQSLPSDQKLNIASARKAFEQMTGIVAPPLDRVLELPFDRSTIYHTLVMEQLTPVRIVLGYHGFKTELALREALISFLAENVGKSGYGIISFPNLIISGQFSIVKFNGQPYCPQMRNDCWDFCGSTNDNPIFLLLELIWTKLEHEYAVTGFWGNDLKEDTFHPLLSAKAVEPNESSGWEYSYSDLTDDDLRQKLEKIPWEPIRIDIYQFTILNRLCKEEKVNTTDNSFVDWLNKEGRDPKQVIAELISTGLVALDGTELKLATEECTCAVLPNGEFVAAENNAGRFSRWLANYMTQK